MSDLSREELDEALEKVRKMDLGEGRIGTSIVWPFGHHEQPSPPRTAVRRHEPENERKEHHRIGR